MPNARGSRKRIILVVGAIAIVILGSVGVYLFLASPTPVLSASINTTGIYVIQTYNVTIGFPKSQMQVSFELISVSHAICDVLNSTDDVVFTSDWLSSPGTYIWTWFNAPPGLYRIIVSWGGTLTAKIVVYARGFPYG